VIAAKDRSQTAEAEISERLETWESERYRIFPGQGKLVKKLTCCFYYINKFQ
jgi:hypothetical protein